MPQLDKLTFSTQILSLLFFFFFFYYFFFKIVIFKLKFLFGMRRFLINYSNNNFNLFSFWYNFISLKNSKLILNKEFNSYIAKYFFENLSKKYFNIKEYLNVSALKGGKEEKNKIEKIIDLTKNNQNNINTELSLEFIFKFENNYFLEESNFIIIHLKNFFKEIKYIFFKYEKYFFFFFKTIKFESLKIIFVYIEFLMEFLYNRNINILNLKWNNYQY